VALSKCSKMALISCSVSAHPRREHTIPGFAYDRVRAGFEMPGVFLVDSHMAIGKAIDQLVVVIECSTPEEWKDRVEFFPL